MKTSYTLLLLSSILSFNVSAQDKAANYIGISGGISAPTGEYSSTNTGTFGNWNNTSGFAKTGFNLGLEGAYHFLPKIGIAGIVNFSDHGRLSNSDAQKLGASYTDAFAVDYSTVSTQGRYQTINLFVGPCFSLPVQKVTFEARILGGLTQNLSSPEIYVTLEDNPNGFKQKSSSHNAFGWQAGIGVHYRLTEKIAISIREDYFETSGIKIDNENRNNAAGRLVTKQTMSWINGSVGIAYTWGR
jgi:opacity protein-like surface antigen